MRVIVRIGVFITLLIAILWSYYVGDENASSSSSHSSMMKRTRITILTTNDLHSVAHKYETLNRYLRHVQDEVRDRDDIVITLDAGDWFSGSMYDRLSVSSTHATPQLDFFHMAQYDAITLGNHEFDAGEKGLITMFSSHSDRMMGIPILNSDIEFRDKQQQQHTTKLQDFYDPNIHESAPEKGVRIQSSLVITRQGLKIGILGVMGPDSALLCQHSRETAKFSGFSDSTGLLRFDRVSRKVRDVTRRLRSHHNCDIVILVAHSGGDEIYNLASSVSDAGVDVVVGGHTHETQFHEIETETSYYDAFFSQPQAHKKRHVFVTQCGSDGDYVGRLELDVFTTAAATAAAAISKSSDMVLKVSKSTQDLISSSSTHSACVSYEDVVRDVISFEEDDNEDMNRLVRSWQSELSEILGRNPADIVFRAKEGTLFSHDDTRSSVAQLVADGILKILNRRLSTAKTASLKPRFEGCENQIDVYLTCPDCVRALELPAQNQSNFELTFEEVYRMLSISASKGISIFHMRKFDLVSIVELAEFAEIFVSDTMKLSISSTMRFHRQHWGIPFLNRLSNVTIRGVPYDELNDFVCVALNGYITPYFFLVNHLSKGLLNNFPRDPTGTLIESISDISRVVDRDSEKNISEYELFVEYLSSLRG